MQSRTEITRPTSHMLGHIYFWTFFADLFTKMNLSHISSALALICHTYMWKWSDMFNDRPLFISLFNVFLHRFYKFGICHFWGINVNIDNFLYLFHCFIAFTVIGLDPCLLIFAFGTVRLFFLVFRWCSWVFRVKKLMKFSGKLFFSWSYTNCL